MADKIVLVDTSILIDYFRKTDKSRSTFVSLYQQGYDLAISAISEYEIYSGATAVQIPYWEDLLKKTGVIPFDKNVVATAVSINKELKLKRKQIGIADLFIAATAITHGLSFATLNKKHFERIDKLTMIE